MINSILRKGMLASVALLGMGSASCGLPSHDARNLTTKNEAETNQVDTQLGQFNLSEPRPYSVEYARLVNKDRVESDFLKGADGGSYKFNRKKNKIYSVIQEDKFHTNVKFVGQKRRASLAKTTLETSKGKKAVWYSDQGVAKINGQAKKANVTYKFGADSVALFKKSKSKLLARMYALSRDRYKGSAYKLVSLLKIKTSEGYLIEKIAYVKKGKKFIDIGIRSGLKGFDKSALQSFDNGYLPTGLLGQSFDYDRAKITTGSFNGQNFKVPTLDARLGCSDTQIEVDGICVTD